MERSLVTFQKDSDARSGELRDSVSRLQTDMKAESTEVHGLIKEQMDKVHAQIDRDDNTLMDSNSTRRSLICSGPISLTE